MSSRRCVFPLILSAPSCAFTLFFSPIPLVKKIKWVHTLLSQAAMAGYMMRCTAEHTRVRSCRTEKESKEETRGFRSVSVVHLHPAPEPRSGSHLGRTDILFQNQYLPNDLGKMNPYPPAVVCRTLTCVPFMSRCHSNGHCYDSTTAPPTGHRVCVIINSLLYHRLSCRTDAIWW